MLDESGDTTIVWDEDTEEKIIPIIAKKMDEGFVFYITKTVPILNITRLSRAKSLDEIRKAGSATIKDEALEQLFLTGSVGTARSSDNVVPIRKAKDAREVAQNQSVGVRPRRGG
jgi:hypothetical protein